MKIIDPSTFGSYEVKTVIYNSEGVFFDEKVPAMKDYIKYNNPETDYLVHRRVDLSSFRVGIEVYPTDPPFIWPFDISSTPLMGILTLPDNNGTIPDGKFPLVVFLHGNHPIKEDSAPGYQYLCNLLSSHGMICCSVAQEYLLQIAFDEESWTWLPENGSRVISLLEHVKQFRIWNNQAGHPLEGKVDLDNIMLVGHSRGGESVSDASTYNLLQNVGGDKDHPEIKLDGTNGLGPYSFNFKAVVAIAPTLGIDRKSTFTQRVRDNYFILNGMRDGDVNDFQGYEFYSMTNRVDLNDPQRTCGNDKGLWWVSGANHNYFNSVWADDLRANATITPEEQRQFSQVYIASIAYAYLLKDSDYKLIIKDHTYAKEFLIQDAKIISQYQGSNRLFIQHNQEGTMEPQISSPFRGSVLSENISLSRRALGFGEGESSKEILLRMEIPDSTEISTYSLILKPYEFKEKNYSALSINIGKNKNEPNQSIKDYNFTITIKDTAAREAEFNTENIHPVIQPDVPAAKFYKTVLQTLRIDFDEIEIKGVDATSIAEITFTFPSSDGVVLYCGNIFIGE